MLASISGGIMVSVIADAAICRKNRQITGKTKFACPTYGCDGGRLDVVLGTFTVESLGEGNETHLGSTVVGLAKVAWIFHKH